jgi:hypothetical protein
MAGYVSGPTATKARSLLLVLPCWLLSFLRVESNYSIRLNYMLVRSLEVSRHYSIYSKFNLSQWQLTNGTGPV